MKKPESTTYDVIVIGGGPAGMMTAGRAAELGAHVLLIEKNEKPGKKLLITGGRRCNVTNAEFDNRKLLEKFKGKGKFLFSAFSQFSVSDALEFFHSHGMPTIIEEGQRVFPKSERAQSVWNVLHDQMKKKRVTILTNSPCNEFVLKSGHIVGVKLLNGDVLHARSYVLATGGMSRPETGSTGEGFTWLEKIGHTVSKPNPALVPIRTKEAWAHKLSGLAYKDVKVSLFQNGVLQYARIGKILFTHVGLSGPLILNMSKDIGELLTYGPVGAVIDLFPKEDQGTLDKRIQEIFRIHQNKKIKNVLGEITEKALAQAIPSILQLPEDKEVNNITRDERLRIVKFLKAIPLTPTGLLGIEKAVVTSGGVVLEEVDFKTMRSRIHENLSLVGDVLDIDRPSGGYSLQLCWTTGFVAGTHVAESI